MAGLQNVQLASAADVALPQDASLENTTGTIQSGLYRLRYGDVVSVKFVRNPELDTTTAVRPDGNISLPMIGEVQAMGTTLPALRTTLSQQYKHFITQTGYGEVLREGDYFDLRFVYNPELNLGVRIRSDGKISLPLLGEIEAAGQRPAELYQHLLTQYGKHLTDPDLALLVGPDTAKKIFADEPFIVVTLSKSAAQRIFVGGEVTNAKVVQFEGQISTLQAIMQAGGVKDTGDLSQVVVLRRGQFEQANWARTDLSEPLSGRSLANDLLLSDGDVVIVPMSGIAKVDLFVKQYIRDVLPLQSSFNVTVIPVDSSNDAGR
jgi:polysaccharide export outer membrane protein